MAEFWRTDENQRASLLNKLRLRDTEKRSITSPNLEWQIAIAIDPTWANQTIRATAGSGAAE